MRFGHSEECLEHETGERHPETADRVRAIRRALSKRHGVRYHEAPRAATEVVETVHDPAYLEELRSFCEAGGGNWDPDTVAVEATCDAALRSAGLASWAATEALARPAERDIPFSLGRPPGHHALEDEGMGFCFLNNVAIATQSLRSSGAADRVAIVDWDVHHGNGTQDIFYDRADVLFASVHEQGLYPGTGDESETGIGAGEGTTVNVPLQAGAGDLAYGAVLEEVVGPAIERFDPDVVLVSAGFDAHEHDPISRMRISSEGYGYLARQVADIADRTDAGLGFVLEGGYSLDMLADGITTVHEVFHGREPMDPEGRLDDELAARIDAVADRHDL